MDAHDRRELESKKYEKSAGSSSGREAGLKLARSLRKSLGWHGMGMGKEGQNIVCVSD